MKIATILPVATLAILGAVCASAAAADRIDRTTVPALDLHRYMGTWYEIARYNHSFERGLSAVKAHYRLRPDGRVEVVNEGTNFRTGKRQVTRGKAHAGSVPGRLRVSFFWFFYSDYNVMELGPNYDWALVGSRSSRFLWILSRTPSLPGHTLNRILRLAQKRGYNTSKLLFVDQQF